MDEMTTPGSGPSLAQSGPSLGRRVAYWRARRGMSQQVFADRLGKSKSWVDKIERGVRRLDRFSVLQQIAEVLQVDVRLVLDAVPHQRTASASGGVDPTMVTAIGTALTRYGGWGHRPKVVPDPAELGQAVAHAWMSLDHADYDKLLRGLPTLITHGQWAHADHRDDESAALLGQTYQITAHLLHRVGEHHLGWLAADRALVACADFGDPLWAARAAIPLTEVVRATGRAHHATELATTTIHRLARPRPSDRAEPYADGDSDSGGGGDSGGGAADRWRIVGALLLQAAIGAAVGTDQGTTTHLLDQAAHTADHLDTDHGTDTYRTCFGPALVDVTRLAAAVELGHGRRALHQLDGLTTRPDYQRLPAAVRAAHLIDVARAHLQAGDPHAAAPALLDAAQIAPDEIRSRPVARATLAATLSRLDQPGPIAQLAETIGVTA